MTSHHQEVPSLHPFSPPPPPASSSSSSRVEKQIRSSRDPVRSVIMSHLGIVATPTSTRRQETGSEGGTGIQPERKNSGNGAASVQTLGGVRRDSNPSWKGRSEGRNGSGSQEASQKRVLGGDQRDSKETEGLKGSERHDNSEFKQITSPVPSPLHSVSNAGDRRHGERTHARSHSHSSHSSNDQPITTALTSASRVDQSQRPTEATPSTEEWTHRFSQEDIESDQPVTDVKFAKTKHIQRPKTMTKTTSSPRRGVGDHKVEKKHARDSRSKLAHRQGQTTPTSAALGFGVGIGSEEGREGDGGGDIWFSTPQVDIDDLQIFKPIDSTGSGTCMSNPKQQQATRRPGTDPKALDHVTTNSSMTEGKPPPGPKDSTKAASQSSAEREQGLEGTDRKPAKERGTRRKCTIDDSESLHQVKQGLSSSDPDLYKVVGNSTPVTAEPEPYQEVGEETEVYIMFELSAPDEINAEGKPREVVKESIQVQETPPNPFNPSLDMNRPLNQEIATGDDTLSGHESVEKDQDISCTAEPRCSDASAIPKGNKEQSAKDEIASYASITAATESLPTDPLPKENQLTETLPFPAPKARTRPRLQLEGKGGLSVLELHRLPWSRPPPGARPPRQQSQTEKSLRLRLLKNPPGGNDEEESLHLRPVASSRGAEGSLLPARSSSRDVLSEGAQLDCPSPLQVGPTENTDTPPQQALRRVVSLGPQEIPPCIIPLDEEDEDFETESLSESAKPFTPRLVNPNASPDFRPFPFNPYDKGNSGFVLYDPTQGPTTVPPSNQGSQYHPEQLFNPSEEGTRSSQNPSSRTSRLPWENKPFSSGSVSQDILADLRRDISTLLSRDENRERDLVDQLRYSQEAQAGLIHQYGMMKNQLVESSNRIQWLESQMLEQANTVHKLQQMDNGQRMQITGLEHSLAEQIRDAIMKDKTIKEMSLKALDDQEELRRLKMQVRETATRRWTYTNGSKFTYRLTEAPWKVFLSLFYRPIKTPH